MTIRRLVRPPNAAHRQSVVHRRDGLKAPAFASMAYNRDAPPRLRRSTRFRRPAQGRCGYGTRMPLLVISRFAKVNFVDHTLSDKFGAAVHRGNWPPASASNPGAVRRDRGSLTNMFDFDRRENDKAHDLFLDPPLAPSSPSLTTARGDAYHRFSVLKASNRR